MTNDEAQENWQQARDLSQSISTRQLTIRLITANEWSVTNGSFTVSADISDLREQHGDGVYTIVLRAEINGEPVPISEYSIFLPPLSSPHH